MRQAPGTKRQQEVLLASVSIPNPSTYMITIIAYFLVPVEWYV